MVKQLVKLQDIKLNDDELALLKVIQEQEPHRNGSLLGFAIIEKGDAALKLLEKLQTESVIAGFMTCVFTDGDLKVLDEEGKPVPDSLAFMLHLDDAAALGITGKRSAVEQLKGGTSKSALQR